MSTLSQIAANDDLFPTFGLAGSGQTAQLNEVALPTDNQNVPPHNLFQLVILAGDIISQISLLVKTTYIIDQPYSGYPGRVTFNGSGASGCCGSMPRRVSLLFGSQW